MNHHDFETTARAYFSRLRLEGPAVDAVIASPPAKVVNGIEYRPLPEALWGKFHDADPGIGLGGCGCPYCTPDGDARLAGAWDTLTWSPADGKVWRCHAPELRKKKRLRKHAWPLRSLIEDFAKHYQLERVALVHYTYRRWIGKPDPHLHGRQVILSRPDQVEPVIELLKTQGHRHDATTIVLVTDEKTP
ncbi:MAG: hypothetical protein Q8Q29_08475 [Actinomycetota bacterium]|nr:hypothetical protein [Actinomycetota bacterium]